MVLPTFKLWATEKPSISPFLMGFMSDTEVPSRDLRSSAYHVLIASKKETQIPEPEAQHLAGRTESETPNHSAKLTCQNIVL